MFKVRVNRGNNLALNIDFTNLIKFISCWLIALHHFAQYQLSHNLSSHPLFLILSAQGGYLGVAIFFFLSGYGLTQSYNSRSLDFFPFLKHRLIKVYTPVILLSLVYSIISLVSSHDLGIVYRSFLSIILCHGYLWFVAVILLCYVSFIIYKYLHKSINNGIYTLLFLLLFVVILCLFTSKVWLSSYHSMSIPLFYCGVLVCEYEKYLKSFLNKNIFVVITFIVFISIMMICDLLDVDIVYFSKYAFVNYIFILCLIVFSARYDLQVSIKTITSASYDIYLVHQKVIDTIFVYCNDISVLLYVFIVSICSYIFYHIRKCCKI